MCRSNCSSDFLTINTGSYSRSESSRPKTEIYRAEKRFVKNNLKYRFRFLMKRFHGFWNSQILLVLFIITFKPFLCKIQYKQLNIVRSHYDLHYFLTSHCILSFYSSSGSLLICPFAGRNIILFFSIPFPRKFHSFFQSITSSFGPSLCSSVFFRVFI